jgi:hypothetical protein
LEVSFSTAAADWLGVGRHWQSYVLTFLIGDPREGYSLCSAIWQYVHANLLQIRFIIVAIHRKFLERELTEDVIMHSLVFLHYEGFVMQLAEVGQQE